MIDFPKYRADVDQALNQAISSRDTNALQTDIQQGSSRLKTAAYLQAGEAIGGGIERGLTKAFDPTERLQKQNMIRQSQAAATAYQEDSLANQVRGTAKDYTGEGAYGLAGIKENSEQRLQGYVNKNYGANAYRDMPQDAKDEALALFKELRGPAGGGVFHEYPRDIEKKAGPRLGTKAYMGKSKAEAGEHLQEKESQRWDYIQNLPSMKAWNLKKSADVEFKKNLKREGLPGPLAVFEGSKDQHKAMQAAQISEMLDDETMQDYELPDGTVIHDNIRGIIDKKLMSPAFVRRNIVKMKSRAPRMAVTNDGKVETYHSTFDKDVLAQVSTAKDKVDYAFYRNLLNKPIDTANEQAAKWDISPKLWNKVMGMGWMASVKDENKERAKQLVDQLGGFTRDKGGVRIGQVAISRLNGVSIGDEELADAMDVANPGQSVSNVLATLDELKKIAPGMRAIITPTEKGGKGKTEYDLTLAKAKEESMREGTFEAGAGPLYGLLPKQVTAEDASELWTTMHTANVSNPHHAALVQQYVTKAGMNPKDAAAMALSQTDDFNRALSTAMKVKDPADPDKEWTDAELESLKAGIVEDLARPSIDAFKISKGAGGGAATNSVAGRPPDSLTYNQAQSVVDRFVAAKPELKDKGMVRISLGGDRTVIAINGKAMGFAKGDKAETFSVLKGDFPTHMVESLHVAGQMARDLVGMDYDKSFQWNSISPLKSTGDAAIDKMMQAPVSGDGSSTYLWLKNFFKKNNSLNTDTDNAEALYINLAEASKKSGESLWDMQKRLNAAAAKTEDPVLEATAIFLGEALNPQKFTMKDLEDIKGGYDASMMSGAAKDATREEIHGADSRPFDEQNADQDKGTLEHAAKVEDEKGAEWYEYAIGVGSGAVLGMKGGVPGMVTMGAAGAAYPAYKDAKKYLRENPNNAFTNPLGITGESLDKQLSEYIQVLSDPNTSPSKRQNFERGLKSMDVIVGPEFRQMVEMEVARVGQAQHAADIAMSASPGSPSRARGIAEYEPPPVPEPQIAQFNRGVDMSQFKNINRVPPPNPYEPQQSRFGGDPRAVDTSQFKNISRMPPGATGNAQQSSLRPGVDMSKFTDITKRGKIPSPPPTRRREPNMRLWQVEPATIERPGPINVNKAGNPLVRTVKVDRGYMLLPSDDGGGAKMSLAETLDQFDRTGNHLGVFSDEGAALDAARDMRQAQQYSTPGSPTSRYAEVGEPAAAPPPSSQTSDLRPRMDMSKLTDITRKRPVAGPDRQEANLRSPFTNISRSPPPAGGNAQKMRLKPYEEKGGTEEEQYERDMRRIEERGAERQAFGQNQGRMTFEEWQFLKKVQEALK